MIPAVTASTLDAECFFHRGITPCMIGIVPYAGLDIAAFELMREKLDEKHAGRPPPHYLLFAGMLSSTGAQLVAYPLGLIRTRLQARVY